LLEIVHCSITNLKFGGMRRVNMPDLSCWAYISQHIKFKIGSNIVDVTHEFWSQGWHSSYLMPSCEGCVLYMYVLSQFKMSHFYQYWRSDSYHFGNCISESEVYSCYQLFLLLVPDTLFFLITVGFGGR